VGGGEEGRWVPGRLVYSALPDVAPIIKWEIAPNQSQPQSRVPVPTLDPIS